MKMLQTREVGHAWYTYTAPSCDQILKGPIPGAAVREDRKVMQGKVSSVC